ncbi:MAG: Thiol:disulfide interchange protein DsbD precursor [Candidatus Omnitrophica bacterium ADurb.Bin277]|nr:MAG: Thiol:disulfide interchange protein DsbD precursor [Candidatus Omnitrophica bacterium ADurb.Bin277]
MEYFAYFLLGLSLNLTPCVYPMITITLSLFKGSSPEDHRKSFIKALVYVGGITVMFTSIGLGAALTGEFFGSLLQNFWVLLLMGVFIIGLSLSMFGLYTFRLPSRLIPQRKTPVGKSLFEFFVSGLLVGVIAAPCVGPVILSLLTAVSHTGDALYGAVAFMILALGMGSPYLVLGTFSGLLKKLPRSGAWLIWFERLLAVILFSFGVFYLIIAFRLPVVQWLVPTALLAGGIYLGWLEHTAHEFRQFRIFKRAIGTVAAGAGLLMIAGMVLTHSGQGVEWEKYRAGILDEARESARPVILDFYADWCIPCHDLEKYTFSDPRVAEALSGFRRIKADATYLEKSDLKELIRDLKVFGVPTIVMLDDRGMEIDEMRISGYIGPDEFLEMMRLSDAARFLPDLTGDDNP